MVFRAFKISNPLTCKRDGSSPTGLAVRDLSVTLDKSWAPYCQAQLTLQTPGAANILGIEPRQGLRTRFTMGMDDLQGNVFSFPFDLALRSRSLDWAAGTATLTATSDEALWQDFASATSGGAQPNTRAAAQTVAGVLGYDDGARYLEVAGAPSVANDVDTIWAPGTTAWDYASQQAESGGAWLYSDERGVFRYAPQTYSPDTTLRTFDDKVVINVVDSVSRDDGTWANYAVVVFQPDEGTTSYVDNGAGGTDPRRAIVVTRPFKKPTGTTAAATIRTKAQKRGRSLTVTAIADIRCRPNQPALVSYQGQSFNGTIRAVTFSLPAGTMTATVDVIES